MVDENINNNDAIITALNYMGCKDIAYTDNCPNPSVLPNRTQQLSQEKINDN